MIVIDVDGPSGTGKSTTLVEFEDKEIVKVADYKISIGGFSIQYLSSWFMIKNTPFLISAFFRVGYRRPIKRLGRCFGYIYILEKERKKDSIVLVEQEAIICLWKRAFLSNKRLARKIHERLFKNYDYAVIRFICDPNEREKRLRERSGRNDNLSEYVKESDKEQEMLYKRLRKHLLFYSEIDSGRSVGEKLKDLRKNVDKIKSLRT